QKLETIGPLELRTILRIGLQVAEGLAAAHRQGLIHRDIKPANILLENGVERVKITDFGLARAVDDASLTQSGYIAGTPQYMSPEQARGERVDHRTDLFSLGSVLYTLCAGHPPFRAENTMAVLKRVCEDTPRPLREISPEIPEWMESLIAKLQAKDPAERIANAAEVAALLSRRLAQLQSRVEPSAAAVPPFEDWWRRWRNRLAPPGRRVPLRWAALALVVIGAVVAGWLFATNWRGNPGPANDDNAGTQPPPAPAAPATPVKLTSREPLTDHSKGVRAVAFSPDGKVLASGGMDKNIFLWDTQTWQSRSLPRQPGEVSALDFSPKDGRLASVTSDKDDCLVRLWNVETAEPAGKLGPGGISTWCVKFSPDGKTVACGGTDRKLRLLDVETGIERKTVDDVDKIVVRTVSFSLPDGRLVATGGDRGARLWDTTTGGEVANGLFPIPIAKYPVFLPGGRGLVTWHFRPYSPITLFPSGKAPY